MDAPLDELQELHARMPLLFAPKRPEGKELTTADDGMVHQTQADRLASFEQDVRRLRVRTRRDDDAARVIVCDDDAGRIMRQCVLENLLYRSLGMMQIPATNFCRADNLPLIVQEERNKYFLRLGRQPEDFFERTRFVLEAADVLGREVVLLRLAAN